MVFQLLPEFGFIKGLCRCEIGKDATLMILLIELLVLFPLFIEPMCSFALEEGSEYEHGVTLAGKKEFQQQSDGVFLLDKVEQHVHESIPKNAGGFGEFLVPQLGPLSLASEEMIDEGQHNTRHDTNKNTGQDVFEGDAQKNIFKILVVIVAEVLGFVAGYFGTLFFLRKRASAIFFITHRNNGYKERETS